jgi:hypothetical protein
MTNTETIGFELITLNGIRTFDVLVNGSDGSSRIQQNVEPYFCKGITRTTSIITYTDFAQPSYSQPRTNPEFTKIYAKTSFGTNVDIGAPTWELISYRSTPYGDKYKNESNWRSNPTL